MKLKELVEELNKTEKIANQEIESVERRFRPGREMARNQAREKMAELKSEYQEELAKTLVLKFVPNTFKTDSKLTFDSNALYAPLVKSLKGVMTNNAFLLDHYFMTIRFLTDTALELGLDQYSVPDLDTNKSVANTTEELYDLVKSYDRSTNGLSLTKAFAENLISDLALKNNISDDRNVIYIFNENQEQKFASQLFDGCKTETLEEETATIPQEVKNTPKKQSRKQ